MKNIVILSILFLFSSCIAYFEKKDIIGIYTPSDYKNNFDTLELKPNQTYQRKVYDKNKKLLLDMNGKWTLERSEVLEFVPFYLNLDDDLIKFPHLVKDTTGGWSGSLEREAGTLQFCTGYYSGKLPNQNCYKKIK